jgi:3-mercaptopyruvate sulfurtransferase SseA
MRTLASKVHEEAGMKQHQDDAKSGWRITGRLAALVLCGGIALVAGCSSPSEDTSHGGTGVPPVTLTTNTPAAIAVESDADYNNNTYGLITGAKLKSWISDWIANRPAGITGKLIILQSTTGEVDAVVPYNYSYIKPNNLNVFTYLSPSSEWTMTRSNGVITTPSMVIDGPTMDANLKKYNIDPHNDMIVCTQGTASTGNVMNMGRCWFALRYWGVDAKHLAVLNGGNKSLVDSGAMLAADFATSGSSAPGTGVVSIKSVLTDNTAMMATVEDMFAIQPTYDVNVHNGTFLWDARTILQYSAGEMQESGDSGCTPADPANYAYCVPPAGFNRMSSFQNQGSRQGHPNGSIQLNFTNLLDCTAGCIFKDKATLAGYLNGDIIGGKGMMDGTYQFVGPGNAYQAGDTIYVYCETTFRAMITGLTSAVILGKPTRFYDGGMIEWNSLSYLQDATGNFILPIDSPWRSDVKSFFWAATSPTLVAQRTINDPYAANTHKIVQEDQLYKNPAASTGGGGSGGGSGPLPNPCGG